MSAVPIISREECIARIGTPISTIRIGKKADAMLQAHGSDRDHILRAEVFVRDQADVATFNEVWDQWINRDTAPARYLAVSKLGREPILVEVVLTAAVR